MNPRLRRLQHDQHELRLLSGHGDIEVHAAPGWPAEEYVLRYLVPGVTISEGSNQPEIVSAHQIRMAMPAEYPRSKPLFQAMTRVFHPNFDDHIGGAVCIQDFWTAGIPISDIVIKVGMMLQYQIYNVTSPLNPVAARWVTQNEHSGIFPVGTIDLFFGEPEVSLGSALTISTGN